MVRKLFIFAALTPALMGACFAQSPAQMPLSITPAIDDAPTKAHDYDWMARHDSTATNRAASATFGSALSSQRF